MADSFGGKKIMYKIIGADGRHYGPADAEQIKRWVAEGRARAETLVQAEGSAEWKPLGSFPELAAALQPPQVSPVPPGIAPVSSTLAAKASNKIPAGVCGILLGGLGIHKFILGYTGAGVIMLLISVLTCGIGAGVMHIIGLIEGIIYLAKSDEEFVRVYVDGRKEWF
jgi:TM2 domain-containing membrane protein YozV